MNKGNILALLAIGLLLGFLTGLGAESSARNKNPYVIAYKKANSQIKSCEAALPRNKHCEVFFKFEVREVK